jgi:glycosyltransferase involved in cell wall biosynthesis
VTWFVQQAMPLLRRALPGVRLRVYGSNMPPAFERLAEGQPDVVLEGWVEDVATVYDSCRIFIAPLQEGAGIKGKVIGALAHGVPCVLSPVAAEGITAGEGDGALLASRPAEWVAAIASLYQDAAAWRQASQQALAFAARQYGFDQGVERMRQALEEIGIYASRAGDVLVARSTTLPPHARA